MELIMILVLHIHLICQQNRLKRKTGGKCIEMSRTGGSIYLILTNQTLRVEDLSLRSAQILTLWSNRRCWSTSTINSLQNSLIRAMVLSITTLDRKVVRLWAKKSLTKLQARTSTWYHRISTFKSSKYKSILKQFRIKVLQILIFHNHKWNDQWLRVVWNPGSNPSLTLCNLKMDQVRLIRVAEARISQVAGWSREVHQSSSPWVNNLK